MARLYLAGDTDDLEAALRVEWLTPRAMQVDPAKDTKALIDQINAGLVSRRQAVASFGWNIDELDRERAQDRRREADLKLTGEEDESDA